MLANPKQILNDFKAKNQATFAFNTTDIVTTQAIIEAAVETKTDFILQITKKTLEYKGDVEIVNLALNMIEQRTPKNLKVGLHLDHGNDFQTCKHAIELGFNSIMIDGSQLSYEENKNLTKRVVDYAHKKNIPVQGELGTVPYIGKHVFEEDDDSVWDEYMTDPDQAQEFVEFTKIDTLAIAIGNAHGFQKERSSPDWERLEKITQKINLPLIMHGASDWTENKIKQAVKRGVSCFNIDTDIRVAYISKLCDLFENECRMDDPRKVMQLVKRKIKEKVIQRIKTIKKNEA
ncbi:MAG: ketose-bisphosphate aldolase [Candidatus Moranbacteria bacterium]|nr:ketose-bisphosphate aldolase [Candidatus Moranbacteria bacterium]